MDISSTPQIQAKGSTTLPPPATASTKAAALSAGADAVRQQQPQSRQPKKMHQQQEKPSNKKPQQTKSQAQLPVEELPLMLHDLFDFDCNLTHEDLIQDVEATMQSGAAVGVTEMLVPGATLEESRAAIDLCRQYPNNLFPTAGVHPYNALALPTDAELAALNELAQVDECRAVGECGLDYSPSFPDHKLQQEWFRAQLQLACALKKPLFLHERLAHDDFMALIKNCQQQQVDGYFPPAVVHCFTGNAQELRAYVAEGFYIGVTGFICKKEQGALLREMVRDIPLHKLVIETDAPYMGFPKCRRHEPSNMKKQYPNVPSALPLVAEVIATALGKTPQEIATITRANARRFLRLSV